MTEELCCQGVAELLSPRFFKALADPNRINILAAFAESGSPLNVSQIARFCPVNISVVSRHLAMMRDAGILAAQKQGKEVYYRLRGQKLAGILRSMADAIEACCPADEEDAVRE